MMRSIRNLFRKVSAMAVFLAVSAPAASWALEGFASPEDQAALLRRGTECFLHLDYERAREAFAEAYAQHPSAALLLKLGLSELHSNRPVEAAAHFRVYLTYADEPTAKRESVRLKWLPRAEAQLARLAIVAPAEVQILLDGVAVGRAPLAGPLWVRAGEHDVVAQDGSHLEPVHLMVHAGDFSEVDLTPPVDSGPPSPARVAPLPEPSAAGERPVGEPPAASPHLSKWVPVVVLGSLAAVAAGAGIGFALASQGDARNAQLAKESLGSAAADPSSCSQLQSAACARLSDAISAQGAHATVADVAYVAAGALGLGAAAVWALWPRSGGGGVGWTLAPTLTATSAGLGASSAW